MGLIDFAAVTSNRIKQRLMTNERFREAYYRVWSSSGFSQRYQHERMLACRVRMEKYNQALTRNISEGDTLVDLGTGTGILSLFAARKRPRKIFALDHSQSMIDYARTVAAANQCNNITFVAGHSKGFRCEEPLDAIIHEQMGDMLFQERMIENIIDLRDRVLKPGGRVYPARFEFYLEPVQLNRDKRVPFISEINVDGITFPPMPGGESSNDALRYIDPSDVEFELCKPSPVYTCDLETLKLEEVPKTLSIRKPVTRSGELDGVCSYFTAHFDDEISLGTGPHDPRTCWAMPLLRVPRRTYREGEIFDMSISVPTLSEYKTWQWTING